ncbi:MAG TPA: TIGR02206 family membrane protein [Thermotogota bacterium]|nr:TIGR02206 family membrane protein [Thermotogota bacterium]HPJ89935.1 TIGR02206 family membrane protein [Thermotogota bacterium]HPR96634.1 TIGR02206 family membrane protein [Thermotogota bacterium]
MDFKEFFSYTPQKTAGFQLFGRTHVVALLSIVFFIVLLTFISRKSERFGKFYKYFLLFAIITMEVAYRFWNGIFYQYRPDILFNLELCGVSIILIIYILIRYNQYLFEILYFWGLGGATQALLTPDITLYGFPHFRFFQFFISHGLIIACVFYFLLVEKKRIRPGALKRAVIFTNIYAGSVFIINMIAGTNYMFLNQKPKTASVMDMLGPWPFSLLGMELLLIAVFGLIYLPVFIINRREMKLSSQEVE